MIKLEKINILIIKNLQNLTIHEIIKILLVISSTYAVYISYDSFMFYVKYYIDCHQFN